MLVTKIEGDEWKLSITDVIDVVITAGIFEFRWNKLDDLIIRYL